jgi:hypothetical protein
MTDISPGTKHILDLNRGTSQVNDSFQPVILSFQNRCQPFEGMNPYLPDVANRRKTRNDNTQLLNLGDRNLVVQ